MKLMEFNFTGKTALITGSTSGIGRATANQLAAAGAHVIINGRDPVRGEETVAAIRATGGVADFVAADLADVASVRMLAKRAKELGGGHVDILVNNAARASFGPSTEVSIDDIDAAIAINVKAPFVLLAELVPDMVERGSGVIVSVSTMVANFGLSGMALYGSSKAALQLLTKAWAAEFGPQGVRVNAVSPGPTRTEGSVARGAGLDRLASTTPVGKPGTAEDVAAAIVFLASDAARHIHGAILPVDGGRLAV
jgi:NAD(P)-dependent dehydrogenase (short-subunit alcohol dehydrogenase family)